MTVLYLTFVPLISTYFNKISVNKNKTQHVLFMNLMAFELHIRRERITEIPLSVHPSIHAKCAWMIYFQSVQVVIKLFRPYIYIAPQTNNIL